MSIEKHIDNMIQATITRGEFDNLEGKGKPIDLDAYFATPEDVRVDYSVLKSNNFVPEEVDRLKEIADLKQKLTETNDEAENARLKKVLNEKIFALSMIIERNKRRK